METKNNIEQLKENIREYIRQNGNKEITGQILQEVLLGMVDEYPDIAPLVLDLANKVNKVEGKGNNLASFDEDGNLKDSGLLIPVPGVEEKDHVLTSGENGLVWMPKPADGDDTYGVYVKEYKEGHGGSTDGMLTRPQWLASLKGEKGDNAVNPFKGWFDSSGDIPTQGAKKGDYAYVTTNGVSVIWKHNGTAFVNTNETVSQEQTFNSSERLSAVKIDDTHLVNPVGDDETNAPTLAKAEDVMQLNTKLYGITANETKAVNFTIVDDSRFHDGKIKSYTGESIAIISVQGYDKVRFRGYKSTSTTVYCYGFFGVENPTASDTPLKYFPYDGDGTTGNFYREYSADVPTDAVCLVVMYKKDGYTTNDSKFYCYLRTGKTVVDMIPKITNDFADYDDRALSARKGNELHEQLITAIIERNSAMHNNKTFGTIQLNKDYAETDANGSAVRVYDVEGGKTYLFTGQWAKTVSTNNYGYYWVDENNKVVGRILVSGLPIIEDEGSSYNHWENVKKTAPATAVKLYQRSWVYSTYSRNYIVYYGYKEIVSEDKLVRINELQRIGEPLRCNNSNLNSLSIGDNIEEMRGDGQTFVLEKYAVKGACLYKVKGNLPRNWYTYYIYYWADENGNFISRTVSTSESSSAWDTSIASPPEAKYLYVLVCRHTSSSYSIKCSHQVSIEELLEEQTTTQCNKINILAIGNSASQDALMYVPGLLKKIAPNIQVNLAVLMLSSSTSPNHLNNILYAITPYSVDGAAPDGFHYENANGTLGNDVKMYNNGKSYEYEYYDSGSIGWNKESDLVSIQEGLAKKEWDLVVVNGTEKATSLCTLLKKIVELSVYPCKVGIINPTTMVVKKNGRNYTGSGDDEHGRAYPEGNPDGSEVGTLYSRWKNALIGAERIMDETFCDVVFPVNAAICNAISIDKFKRMGDFSHHLNNQNYIDDNDPSQGKYGYLRAPDGVHLQEGLPCQIAAYAVIYKILELCGVSYKSFFGDKTICNSSWITDNNILGKHPDERSGPGETSSYTDTLIQAYATTGWCDSEEENLERVRFAQKCAVMACKHPYEITDMDEPYFYEDTQI